MNKKSNSLLKLRLISSSASIVISLSLVLYVIGLLAYILINTNSFSKKIKENITFSILLKDSAKEIDIVKFQKYIDAEDFAKNSIYINKDEATKNLISELGEDISSRMQEANNGKKTFVKDELWNSFSGLVAKLPDMNEKLFGNDETISKLHASCTKVIEKGGDHYRNKKNKDSDIARSQAIDEIKNSTDQFNDDFWKSFNGGNDEK